MKNTWLIITFAIWCFYACTQSNDVESQTQDATDSDASLAEPDSSADTDAETATHIRFRPGVETVTILESPPGIAVTLVSPMGDDLITLTTDGLGQAHFAYVTAEYQSLESSGTNGISFADALVITPGDGYRLRDDSLTPPMLTEPFRVMGLDDPVDEEVYTSQQLVGTPLGLLPGIEPDPEVGYQYITVRDGVSLGAMIRFPDPRLYGDGPYPTVIEYSGYSPSRPSRPDAPSLIANALGYATVSVNMRGSGCSGGVFDIFNRAQHADGYDVIETVARQPWVLNQQVGMVGLSYPGITQLYVASATPPSLAAIIPLSVIADPWEMQYPGGIYNYGFTQQWVDQREAEATAGGAGWVNALIESGDETCSNNLKLSTFGFDFEPALRAMSTRPDIVNDRDLNRLVTQIDTAVFLAGAFQDEQTGASFAGMLDKFENARALKIMLQNGRHIDGYAPHAVFRWFEFLEFYVAERIPVLNTAIRAAGAQEFGDSFGIEDTTFEEDRFTEYESFEAAREAYEAEPTIRLLFENGAGSTQPGVPIYRYEKNYDSWPPAAAEPISWYLNGPSLLTPDMPAQPTAHQWQFDPAAGPEDFFGPNGYELSVPLWDIDWVPFDSGFHVSYRTNPFNEAQVLSGPGYLRAWVRSSVDEAHVQVTLSEIAPDDTQTLIQSGWLNIGHRRSSIDDKQRVQRTFSLEDYEDIPINEWVEVLVAIPSFAHAMRAGSHLQITISTPGRDHGTWAFEPPVYNGEPIFDIHIGGEKASQLTLSRLPNIDIPLEAPPCPSLRGQPCRAAVEIQNREVPLD